MDLLVRVKMAIYEYFATTGVRPGVADVAAALGLEEADVLEHCRGLADQRVLVLEPDGRSIRMASPFSGVPTQHVVESGGVTYHANCAWDAFGIVAALQRSARVRSRCERSCAPLELALDGKSAPESDWVFHCLVPAAHWWDDIVFT